jgi:subtilisin family serine protease
MVNPVLARELDYVRAARGYARPTAEQFRSRGVELPAGDIYAPGDDEGYLPYLAISRQLLVDDVDVDRVIERLRRREIEAEVTDSRLPGVTVLTVEGDLETACAVVDEELGVGTAMPNHLLNVTPAGWGRMCPATEPEPVEEVAPWPPVSRDGAAGLGVRVCVVDTGYLEGSDSDGRGWLAGIEEFDPDVLDRFPRNGYIDPYAGHGTFTAGVVRCLAPATELTVDAMFQIGGVVDEVELVMGLLRALELNPDVLHLSGGTYTRQNLPPKALVALYERVLRHHAGLIVVCPAGNDGHRMPFWPAAFPWAIGVGAVDADGTSRAEFSNHGSWVDVYAPGVGLVNAYANGKYLTVQEPQEERRFENGMCRWSGTSFAAPIVTGLVAARMSRTGETADRAAQELLRSARGQHLAGVGPRLMP